jgi:putative transposase
MKRKLTPLDQTPIYFITTTSVNRVPIFESDIVKQIIVDSLAFLRNEGGIQLYVFTVMPNHVHFIARINEAHTLADAMRTFKSFTALKILNHFHEENDFCMISILRNAARGIKSQEHKVWEDGYDARDVVSAEFLLQKAAYIHNNPCQPKWHLARCPENYAWSSARYYLQGEPAIIPIDDLRLIL